MADFLSAGLEDREEVVERRADERSSPHASPTRTRCPQCLPRAGIERGGLEVEAEALLLEQVGNQGSALGFGLDERVAVLDLVDGLRLGGASEGQLISGSGTSRPFVHVLTFTDRASLVATGELAAAPGLKVTRRTGACRAS